MMTTDVPVVRVAVVFGRKGGLSDCGAYAALHAWKRPGVELRAVAVRGPGEKTDANSEVRVDVVDAAEKDRVTQEMKAMDIVTVEADSPEAQGQFEAAFEGVQAVVSAFGNRQPGMPRFLASTSRKVVQAMKAKGVTRLVQLSSFGIGDRVIPSSMIFKLWSFLLVTVLRSAKRDLLAMENAISTSGLDYVLVRPVGVDPSRSKIGSWLAVTDPIKEPVELGIAKSDAGLFLLEEALKPTYHKTALTLCQPGKRK